MHVELVRCPGGSSGKAVELEIDDLQVEREGLTRGLQIYERNMDRLEDDSQRAEAARLTHDNQPLFALQAWAPKERSDEIQEYAGANGLGIIVADPSPEEEPPTLLENPSLREKLQEIP